MSLDSSLFFVALVPPISIQQKVRAIQQDFAQRYQSRHALKSPPHITLQPPFKLATDQVSLLAKVLQQLAIAHHPIEVTLSGFAAFGTRVIYINVIKTPELLHLKTQLTARIKETLNIVDPREHQHSFSPHITVAFKDLTRKNFHQAWPEFQQQSIELQLTVPALTLLRHNGHNWDINQEFPLSNC